MAGTSHRPGMAPGTRRTRRRERLAKAVLWAFAGMTMIMLFAIVGYILVNGFYTRNVTDEEVLPVSELEIADTTAIDTTVGSDAGQAVTLIVNRRLRLSEITWTQLNAFLQDPAVRLRKHTWGFLTGQDINVLPAVVSGVSAELFLRDGEQYGEAVRLFDTAAAVVAFVRSERGAIGIVPAAGTDLSSVTQVGLRRLVLAVHPEVLEVQRSQRLRSVTMDQVVSLFDGTSDTWSEIGGPSAEVRPADAANDDPGVYVPLPVEPAVLATSYQESLAELILPLNSEPSDSLRFFLSPDELSEFVQSTPGAVALTYVEQAEADGLSFLPIETVTHERNLRLSFLITPPSRAGAVGGISTIIVNTLVYVLMTLVFATPIGVAAAVYLVEYAKQGFFVRILRIGTDTLAGIPSIIFGLFGLVLFSQILNLKTGLLAGTLTVTLMVLPTIVRTSEEALKTVSRDLREGSMALGSTKLQTIIRVVLPAAAPGILTGMLLAIGRAIGETAAVLYTIGSNMELLRGLNSPVRLLTIHLYMLIRESISIPNAFASATILVGIVFLVNYLTRRLISGRKRRMQ